MKKAINSSLREKTALKWPALFRYFLVALQLLTVIPLNLKKELKPEDEDIANSTFLSLIIFFLQKLHQFSFWEDGYTLLELYILMVWQIPLMG